MTTTFKEMYDAYNACTSKLAQSALHDAMITYSKSTHIGYVCYDMDMYTALYKIARTNGERKDALHQIKEIIADSALDLVELKENFKEFLTLNSVINEDDLFDFELICISFLIKFRAKVDSAKDYHGAGMADFSDNYVYDTAVEYLREISYDILRCPLALEAKHLALYYIETYKWKLSCENLSQLFKIIALQIDMENIIRILKIKQVKQ